MNETAPELSTDKKPEAAPTKPGLVQVLLAVAAALALAFSGLAFIDTLTFLFPEPGIYGFRFLEGTFVQSVATSLSNLDDLNMYAWLGAKAFLTLSLLLLTVPVIFKQLPTRTPKPNAPPL